MLPCGKAAEPRPAHHSARARYEYAEQLFLMREDLGLSMSINPELAAASEIFRLLQFPSFIQRETFAKGRVEIVELRVDEGSRVRCAAFAAGFHHPRKGAGVRGDTRRGCHHSERRLCAGRGATTSM